METPYILLPQTNKTFQKNIQNFLGIYIIYIIKYKNITKDVEKIRLRLQQKENKLDVEKKRYLYCK